MFHNESAEINLSWKNTSRGAIHVAWEALDGDSGQIDLDQDEVSDSYIVSMPHSKIELRFGSLDPLLLDWVASGSSGHFQLQDAATNWEPRVGGGAHADCFGLGTNKIDLQRLLSEDGIVIVGILDIGGQGHD